MRTLIILEPDDDLAECVAGFFGDQYEIDRVWNFEEVRFEAGNHDTAMIFVNIDDCSEEHVAILEQLHGNHPRTRLVVTHLSLPEKAWAERIRGVADILVRKPYGVVDIDRAIRRLDGGSGQQTPKGT